MMKIFSRFALVMALTGIALGQSQVGGGTLNGTVTDPTGAAIPNAKITVVSQATGLERAADTSSAGLYALPLPAGTYDLTVQANGFKSAKLEGLPLAVGAISTIDVRLEVGTAQESVSVTAEIPVVETTRSQTSTNVDARAVAELPVNGRNFLDFVSLTPGVVRDPSRGGDLSFGGQRGTSNSLQVDGSDSNNVFFGQTTGRAGTGRNPYSFSQDAVQEFQVSTNGYAAELGRAGGGLINVITKSGTNAFHGTVFEFFRDKALNANSWENNRIRAPKRNYHFNQFGGNIGGPIARNKAFFFFDYDGQRNSEPVQVIPGVVAPADADSQRGFQSLQKHFGAYPRKLDNNVYLAKGDFNVSDTQRLSVRYNANRFAGVNFENSGPTSALEHTGNSSVKTDNLAATHNWVITPAAVLETRFTFTRDNQPGEANSSAPEAFIVQGGATVISIGRNNFSPRYTNAKTFQWVDSISYIRGRHSVKFGVDIILQRIDNFFPGNFSGAFRFNSYADFANNRPFSLTQAFAGPNTDGPLSKPNVGEYAFYGQDSYRVNDRLTLNYGLRYDIFKYANPKVQNPNPALLAAGYDTGKINLDTNNIAGRFGFAYKVSDNGNLTVRGGYGNFFGRTPAIMTGTAITQNGIQVQTYTLTTGVPAYPNILSAPPTVNRTPDIYVFDKNYVQPVTHQWSLNVERQLTSDVALTVGYLGTRGVHLSRTRDVNWLPYTTLQGTLDGVPVSFPRRTTRANTAFGRISVFDSGADSIYHGGFVQIGKRFSRSFQVQSSYTFSKVIDSKPDFTSVVVGPDDSKNAQDTLSPNLERGRGNSDIRHRFVFSGIWEIDYAKDLQNPFLRNLLRGYQIGVVSSLQSGRPLTISAGGDPNGDTTTATDRPPNVGRNTFEGPSFASADLRVSRDIRLMERASLKLIFEAFNATNRANFSNVNTAQYNYNNATRAFTSNPAFLTRTATFDPRILQLAAKITF